MHVLNQNGKVAAWEEEEVSTSYPGLSSPYQLYFVECEVEGLKRAATGMTFYTGEDCSLEKVHVWEWIRLASAQLPRQQCLMAAGPSRQPCGPWIEDSVKRDLLQIQKRHTTVSKETYSLWSMD